MPTTNPFTLGLIQMRCDVDPEVNLRRAEERIRQAAESGADSGTLIVRLCCEYGSENESALLPRRSGRADQLLALRPKLLRLLRIDRKEPHAIGEGVRRIVHRRAGYGRLDALDLVQLQSPGVEHPVG